MSAGGPLQPAARSESGHEPGQESGRGSGQDSEQQSRQQSAAPGAGGERPEQDRAVPEATVGRLSVYLRALAALADAGTATVSSDALATLAGVNAGLLRKDLSYLGSYGVRGVGYHVDTLSEQVSRVLGLTEDRVVALVGVGNLGQALAGYGGFGSRGFRIAALLDLDPARVGAEVNGMPVRHVDELAAVVAREHISIAVIATPAAAAQAVCDRLVGCGVRSILNFAPVVLSVPADVDVRKVDLAGELQILSFHERRKSAVGAGLGAARAVGGEAR